MAIRFIKEKRRQKYLILVLGIVVLVTAFVLWRGFFKKEEEPLLPSAGVRFRPVRIDFDLLESLALKELQLFEEVPSFVGTKGRENPFLSY